MKDEVAVLGSPSLIVLTVSVDVNKIELKCEMTNLKQNKTQLGLRSTVHQFNCSHVVFSFPSSFYHCREFKLQQARGAFGTITTSNL